VKQTFGPGKYRIVQFKLIANNQFSAGRPLPLVTGRAGGRFLENGWNIDQPYANATDGPQVGWPRLRLTATLTANT